MKFRLRHSVYNLRLAIKMKQIQWRKREDDTGITVYLGQVSTSSYKELCN